MKRFTVLVAFITLVHTQCFFTMKRTSSGSNESYQETSSIAQPMTITFKLDDGSTVTCLRKHVIHSKTIETLIRDFDFQEGDILPLNKEIYFLLIM